MVNLNKGFNQASSGTSSGWLGAIVPAIALAISLGGCAEVPTEQSSVKNDAPGSAADALGIQIDGLRLSATGYMLDFRYRVLDPEKAAPLLDRKVQPYLIDPVGGARLVVPGAPKVGSLRTTSRSKIIPGRSYYLLFANPGRYLRVGSKVTLVAGDVRINDLAVD